MVRAPNELTNLFGSHIVETIVISSVFRRHLIIYIHMNNSPPKKRRRILPQLLKITWSKGNNNANLNRCNIPRFKNAQLVGFTRFLNTHRSQHIGGRGEFSHLLKTRLVWKSEEMGDQTKEIKFPNEIYTIE